MEECLIGTGEACSDKTVFNYVFLSTLVAEYSPYCREHLFRRSWLLCQQDRQKKKKRNYQFRKAEQAAE